MRTDDKVILFINSEIYGVGLSSSSSHNQFYFVELEMLRKDSGNNKKYNIYYSGRKTLHTAYSRLKVL